MCKAIRAVVSTPIYLTIIFGYCDVIHISHFAGVDRTWKAAAYTKSLYETIDTMHRWLDGSTVVSLIERGGRFVRNIKVSVKSKDVITVMSALSQNNETDVKRSLSISYDRSIFDSNFYGDLLMSLQKVRLWSLALANLNVLDYRNPIRFKGIILNMTSYSSFVDAVAHIPVVNGYLIDASGTRQFKCQRCGKENMPSVPIVSVLRCIICQLDECVRCRPLCSC